MHASSTEHYVLQSIDCSSVSQVDASGDRGMQNPMMTSLLLLLSALLQSTPAAVLSKGHCLCIVSAQYDASTTVWQHRYSIQPSKLDRGMKQHSNNPCTSQEWLLPSSDDAPGALDVIAEAQVLVAHLVQNLEGLAGLEVLKLDEAVGEAAVGCLTELSNHLHVFLPCQPLCLAALHRPFDMSKQKPGLLKPSIQNKVVRQSDVCVNSNLPSFSFACGQRRTVYYVMALFAALLSGLTHAELQCMAHRVCKLPWGAVSIDHVA